MYIEANVVISFDFLPFKIVSHNSYNGSTSTISIVICGSETLNKHINCKL